MDRKIHFSSQVPFYKCRKVAGESAKLYVISFRNYIYLEYLHIFNNNIIYNIYL